MRKLATAIIIAFVFASCKDVKTVEYNVVCDDCIVSYWDENGEFVPREEMQGTWTRSFDIKLDPTEADPIIRVSAQSQLCEDATACADTTLLKADSVYVNIKVEGTIVVEDTVGNKAYASTYVETNL